MNTGTVASISNEPIILKNYSYTYDIHCYQNETKPNKLNIEMNFLKLFLDLKEQTFFCTKNVHHSIGVIGSRVIHRLSDEQLNFLTLILDIN